MRRHLVIVGTANSFKQFKSAIDQHELPCIDADAVLEQVVEALSSRSESDTELYYLGSKLYEVELLGSKTGPTIFKRNRDIDIYEDPCENVLGVEYVVDLAKKLGHKLKQEFEALRLYNGDELGYEYHGIIDEHAIVLRSTSHTGRRSETN